MNYVHRAIDMLYNMLPFRMPPEGAILLGRFYTEDEEEAFVQDFASRILFTYRKDFEALPGEGRVTSDAGWGCSIRVAQMQLAECLMAARLSESSLTPGIVAAIRQGVLDMFMDTPEAKFAIHRFIEVGLSKMGRLKTSEWFGPTSAARATSLIAASSSFGTSDVIPAIVAFEDGVIYEDEVKEILHTASMGCIMLLSKKLGLEYFNAEHYKVSIYKTFMIPAFRGLASGESTSSAYFFVAVSEDSLYFLDPHIAVQEAFLSHSAGKFYQEKIPRIPWTRLNASMTLAFYVRNTSDFEHLLTNLRQVDADLFETLPSRVPFRDRPAALVTAGDQDELLLIN